MTKNAFMLSIGLAGTLVLSPGCHAPEGASQNIAEVTFLQVPMVCNAAPDIGCGSRAKFVLLDLMKDPAVEEAWLNRKGTVVAAVWREGTAESARQHVLKTVFSAHELEVGPVSEDERTSHATEFETREGWYKGADVDDLSIEEAGVIADRVLTALTKHASFKNDADKHAFREETKGIMQKCFLSLKSFDELDEPNVDNTQREIYLTAVKYIGEDDMPEPQVLREEYEKLTHEACSVIGDKGACCTEQIAEGSGG